MEKTNELNKFLSYMHMGNTIYRIYLEHAKKLENEKLIHLIIEIQEIFKTHEEAIANLIMMGVYKEKLKTFDNAFDICLSAIKATNMGMISALRFLDENKELSKGIKEYIIKVIDDYGIIINKLKEFLLQEYR